MTKPSRSQPSREAIGNWVLVCLWLLAMYVVLGRAQFIPHDVTTP